MIQSWVKLELFQSFWTLYQDWKMEVIFIENYFSMIVYDMRNVSSKFRNFWNFLEFIRSFWFSGRGNQKFWFQWLDRSGDRSREDLIGLRTDPEYCGSVCRPIQWVPVARVRSGEGLIGLGTDQGVPNFWFFSCCLKFQLWKWCFWVSKGLKLSKTLLVQWSRGSWPLGGVLPNCQGGVDF